jgi:hypothetical protein
MSIVNDAPCPPCPRLGHSQTTGWLGAHSAENDSVTVTEPSATTKVCGLASLTVADCVPEPLVTSIVTEQLD